MFIELEKTIINVNIMENENKNYSLYKWIPTVYKNSYTESRLIKKNYTHYFSAFCKQITAHIM